MTINWKAVFWTTAAVMVLSAACMAKAIFFAGVA